MAEENYLKKELYELIKSDDSIFDFIQGSLLDGFWYWDLENPENEWMNRKFWTVLGYDPDEMPHKVSAWQNIINQDDLKVALDNFTKHCENPDHPYDQVVRYTHKNGSTAWVRCRGMAIRESGKPVRMLGAHHDVTNLKNAEITIKKAKEKAEEHEEKLREVQKIGKIGTWDLNLVTGELKWSDETFQLHGMNPAIDKPDFDAVIDTLGPEFRESFPQAVQASLDSDTPFEGKYHITDLDGISKHIHMIGLTERGADGQPVRMFGIVQDITQHKRIEEELLKAKEKADASEYFLNESQKIGLVGSYYTDFTKGSWTSSEVLDNIFGIDKNYNRNVEGWLRIVYSEDQEMINKYLTDYVIGERKKFDKDYRITRISDGSIRWVHGYGECKFDDNGNILSIIGTIQDITERKNAEEELLKAKEKAEESEEKFKAIFNNSQEAFGISNQGTNVLLNKAFLNLFGFEKQEEILGKSLLELIAPKERNRISEYIAKRATDNGAPNSYETIGLKKDDTEFPFEVSIGTFEQNKEKFSIAVIRDITERKKARDILLMQSEITKNIPEGIYLVSIDDLNILWANSKMETMFGYEPGELKGKHVSIINAPTDDDPVQTALNIQHALQSTGVYRGDVLNIKKDGTVFWGQTTISIMNHSEYGAVFLSIQTDISERKKAEADILKAKEKAEESEGKLRNVLQISQALSYTFELETIMQKIIDNSIEMFGVESGAIYTAQSDNKIYLSATTPPIPPDLPEIFRQAPLNDHPHIKRALNTSSIVIVPDTQKAGFTPAEKQIADMRGLKSVLYVPLVVNNMAIGVMILASTNNLKIFNDEDIKLCLGYAGQAAQTIENTLLFESVNDHAKELEKEISERKKIEFDLRTSEQKYKHLFEAAGDYIFLLSLEKNKGPIIIDANEAAFKAHGYSRDEMIGMSVIDLETEKYKNNLERRKLFQKPGDKARFETEHIRKDGTILPVEVNARLVQIGNNPPFVISIERDITDRKKSEEELRKVAKLETLGIIAGGIAHNFKNILSSMLMSVEIAKRKPDKMSRHLDKIQKSIDQAAALATRFQTFSKTDDPVLSPIDINKVILESIDLALTGSSTTVKPDLADNLPLIMVDDKQFNEVFTNLLLNADQAISNGGLINVRSWLKFISDNNLHLEPGRYVLIEIEDNGSGIPKEQIDEIFTPFFTTKTNGNGLGLASVYFIIQKHQGAITVESEVGTGTKFVIYLPAFGNYNDNTKSDTIPNDIVINKKILLLDDNDDILKNIKELTEDLQLDLYCVNDPEKAISLYKDNMKLIPFDLVILDLTLKGHKMDGYEVLKIIKKINPKVKALVFSGHFSLPIIADYKKYGFAGKIMKPIKIDSFIKEIKRVLNKI